MSQLSIIKQMFEALSDEEKDSFIAFLKGDSQKSNKPLGSLEQLILSHKTQSVPIVLSALIVALSISSKMDIRVAHNVICARIARRPLPSRMTRFFSPPRRNSRHGRSILNA